jgi:ABC-2 type transport system ATP-binding protein
MTWPTALLQAFGLDRHRHAYPSSLSRGMQYKLGLVLALLTHPALLLLDEPYGPLDPFSQWYLAERIATLRNSGVTVVFSTHVLPPSHPPDRVVVLEQGELAADLPWEEASQASPNDVAALPDRLLVNVVKQRRNLPHV